MQKFAYYKYKYLFEQQKVKEEKYKEYNFDQEKEYLTNFYENIAKNKKEEIP